MRMKARTTVELSGQNWVPLDENNDSTLSFESQPVSAVAIAVVLLTKNRDFTGNSRCRANPWP
jgi:hypothetical protein